MLEEARKALDSAWRELEEYRKTRDLMRLRQAAEKGWLAVDKAVEEFLKSFGIEAKTYREKRCSEEARARHTERQIWSKREVSTHRLLLRRLMR